MGFYGCSFSFNGTSCKDYDLIMYNTDDASQNSGNFASTTTAIEENITAKWKPLFFGMKFENKLEFNIVFGINLDRLDAENYLSRGELAEIASWLTGYDGYRWLSIDQEDMSNIRFKCFISNLEILDNGLMPYGFNATVTCDGPFAYKYPTVYTYEVDGSTTMAFDNKSDFNGYYYPNITFELTGGNTISIKNETDAGYMFELTDIPSAVTEIQVDNENGVISNNADLNLYSGFNFNFFRLKRGVNKLTVTGNGKLNILCEFPSNVGG